MIIDFHTHAFPDPLAPKAIKALTDSIDNRYIPVTDGTVAGLVANMNKWNIDRSVLQPVITKASQLKGTNEWAASASSDRIVAFGGIYPHTDDYKRDIDIVCSLGLKGIKLHAEYQNFVLDAPEMIKIYDYALSRGLIIMHHAGYDPAYKPPFRSSPKQFAHIWNELKGGIIIAAHLGGQSQWDDVERYIAGTGIYIDTSMGFDLYPLEQFLRIVRSHGADKILFGSDAPWSNAGHEISVLNGLPIGDAEKAAILGGNAARLLGIQTE